MSGRKLSNAMAELEDLALQRKDEYKERGLYAAYLQGITDAMNACSKLMTEKSSNE